MIIDWGARVNTYPTAWHPVMPGVWDWGHASIVEATGLAAVAFSSAQPAAAFSVAAPAVAFSSAQPGITFTEG